MQTVSSGRQMGLMLYLCLKFLCCIIHLPCTSSICLIMLSLHFFINSSILRLCFVFNTSPSQCWLAALPRTISNKSKSLSSRIYHLAAGRFSMCYMKLWEHLVLSNHVNNQHLLIWLLGTHLVLWKLFYLSFSIILWNSRRHSSLPLE